MYNAIVSAVQNKILPTGEFGRIVPNGNHSEASWEKQVPIFMSCLGL